MSEPIIIETPQPPVRERLMCVPEGAVVGGDAEVRDAEPADLERAGWVPRSALDTQVEATLSNIRRAGHLERERNELVDRGLEIQSILGAQHDEGTLDAVRRLVRERDEARQQRDNLRGNYGDVCALVASAKRILGATEDEDIEQVAERVTRERDEVRLILDASAGETTADAATRLHNDWVDARERADRVERERAVDAISGRARAAIVERDEARAALATWQGSAEQERARCVASIRSHAARLRALPDEPRWAEQRQAIAAHLDIEADRIERGEHAGTPVPTAEPRATDDELVGVYLGAFRSSGPGDVETARRDGIAAVAARVRAEREPTRDETLAAVRAEVLRARAKFPGRAHMLAALVEEVGEVARALLQREGRERVRAEAIQVACVALRIAEEGDGDFDG